MNAGPVAIGITVEAATFANALISGASFSEALRNGAISGVSSWAFASIGSPLPGGAKPKDFALLGLKFGVIGGLTSTLQGGKFGHGFVSAGMGGALGGPLGGALGSQIGSQGAGRLIAGAAISGTASSPTGGKFANGATTAAFTSLFSQLVQGAQETEPPGRGLTKDEITEAQKVFGGKIDYSQVRIIDGKFVPWQGNGYIIAIAPDGNIYWPGECGNLAICGGSRTVGVFIHEMTHVLQVQHGVNVLGWGLLLEAGKFLSGGLYDPYKFTYDPGRSFSSYNIEQQGEYAKQIYFGKLPNNIDY